MDASALGMLLLTVTSWLDRRERETLAYLLEESRLLRRQLGGRAEHDSLFGSIAVAQEDKYFDSQGVRIRYVEQGNGEPVVLLHGQPSNVERQWTTDTRRRSPSPVARGAADQQRQEGHGVDRPPRSRCFPGATRVPRDVLPQRLVFAARGYHEGVALTARAGERGLQHVFNLSKACDLHNTCGNATASLVGRNSIGIRMIVFSRILRVSNHEAD
jgi:hypothetical protein